MATTTFDLLNRVSRKLGDASDYRIAKETGVSKQTVSNWRHGTNTMSDSAGIRVAAILEEDPAQVLALLQAERTDSPEARKVWRRLAASLGGKAAAVLAATLLTAHAPKAPASNPDAQTARAVHCILC
jgi:transcriptional regulator with XRE-family HTH domain